MFASVWLGGTNYQLINLDCMLINVLDLLRKKCNIDDEDVLLDLADEEGMLRSLPDYNVRGSTKLILKPRATYVPIKIERDENDVVKPYEPYVEELKENAEFMKSLHDQYRRKEFPSLTKKEKTASTSRNRGSTSSTSSTARDMSSATKVKTKKGGTASRAGKASR